MHELDEKEIDFIFVYVYECESYRECVCIESLTDEGIHVQFTTRDTQSVQLIWDLTPIDSLEWQSLYTLSTSNEASDYPRSRGLSFF